MLAVEGLTSVRGGRRLFSDLSFVAEPGALLHVAGANGAGKTSLLRILCGLLLPVDGVVRWHGENIHHQHESYCRDLRYIGHLGGIKDELTAVENLSFSAVLSGITPQADAAETALDALGLSRYARVPARMLSQGQRRRIALARLALPDAAALWILDEPLAALDDTAAKWVLGLLGNRLAAGAVVVMTSHQPFAVTGAVQTITIGE